MACHGKEVELVLGLVDVTECDSNGALVVVLLAPVAHQVFGVGIVGSHGEHAKHCGERHIMLRRRTKASADCKVS